ncbi:RagB/SusD family nutrient uptake outer membrane protein [Chitinophaga sp. 22321]|uniref:RagB/SusD family nutrient uptake outer membrane protein n=1 Tax=Chitinophaga hostae TaxID=2831022 RepID=A0ABS5J7L8_9BACT|nr:RagB/SusD family nutrient uptake outer membrane protein [Chitinophaga hostae]MBS0031211.1 RagB/SusD family nutrient uptake outer membrane protein [Chitinophaga hostae]
MKKLLINIGLLVGILSMAGCKKFLETLPDNRTVITTPEQVSQLLTTAYPHGSYMLFCEALSDNVEDKGNGGQGIDPQLFLINTQSFKYQDVQDIMADSPVAYWDSCYAAIAAANLALQYCNGPDAANFSAQKGEALLCRAYAHFMLVTLFSKAYNPATAANDPGIPYITKVSTTVFNKYDRGNVASVYQQIENDLTTGLPLIKDKAYGDAPKFHFTEQAAHAFAARFYLFKRDYAKVVTHATAVFGSASPASLIRDQVKIYSTLQPVDMKLLYTSSSTPANILLTEIPGSKYPDNYYGFRYGIGTNINAALFSYPNVTDGNYAITIYGSGPQYFNFPKFSKRVMPLLSMEEVLMNRAEANVHLKNYNATLSDLNIWISKNITRYSPSAHNVTIPKIMAFYDPLPQDDAMIEAVLDLKRITYMQEGLRWLDILRLDIPVRHTGSPDFNTILAPGDKRRLLQLPPEVVNEGMALNPR